MIVAAGSVTEFFREAVHDALQTRCVEAPGGVTNYLVAVLSDYAHPDERTEQALGRPLAFQLDEALHTVDLAERFERLRSLGDNVLYCSSFFSDHFESKGVDQSYLVSIGTRAYDGAGAMLGPTQPEVSIFPQLASRFSQFVDVLTEVADATSTMGLATSHSVLKVYERWRKTGSARLAKALSSQGILPGRKVEGIQ